MLYINALEAWGWLPPSAWLALTSSEKALLTEIQFYVNKKKKEAMKQ